MFVAEIYLDNSSTTPVCAQAAEAMYRTATQVYGNPSSLHSKGLEAEHILTDAAKVAAQSLGAAPSEIVFTSGGTEANNLAVFGAARARRRLGNKIVTTAAEHSSVYESCKALENEGFTVEYIKPSANGNIAAMQLYDAIDSGTVLVSVMTVNNETGAVFPTSDVRRIINEKSAPALFHTDAVQAYGKIPVKPSSVGADLLTVSSHKIHGPKGVGALYIKKGTHIKPIIYGGEQQRRLRPGTEPVELIAGFAAAVKCLGTASDITDRLGKTRALRDYAVSRLSAMSGIVLNSPEDALPYVISFSALGIKSETMIHFLESKDIYVSGGSACAKGKRSHVLAAMGLPNERIDSAIRVSFSRHSAQEDVDAFADALQLGMSTLVRAK